MKRIVQHLRVNVVAYLALFAALGGTSYAALRLPADSVGTRQIKNHAVTPIKLDPKTIGATVRYWAIIDNVPGSGEQVTASRPRARVTGWDSSSDTGAVSWGRPIAVKCFGLGTAADGFVAARVLPLANVHASVVFSPFTPAGQHTTGRVYVAVLCPQP